ncbi:MAG: SGNH/GDSL hydrolase family protein [Phototrophicales bacterium]|nr:SGNH/GDSL hydrolase family protein [Phototrophicales bacterium]
MKLIFLGDSLTEGSYGGSYLAHITKLRPNDTLINAGVGGDTVINLERRLDDVIDQSPDGIFVMVGGNDAISYSQPDTRPYYKQAKSISNGFVSPEQFSQTYRDILTRLQTEHLPTWVGLPPIEYNPLVAQTMRDYNESVADMARSMNIPTLDLMPDFMPQHIPDRKPLGLGIIFTIGERTKSGWSEYDTTQSDGNFAYTFDGIHLTPKSAVQFGERIHHFLGA